MRYVTNKSTIDSRLSSGQRMGYFSATKRNDLLRFSYLRGDTNSSLSGSLIGLGGGQLAYINSSGVCVKKAFNPATDVGLTGGTALTGTFHSLRNTVGPDGKVYRAAWSSWGATPVVYADNTAYSSASLPVTTELSATKVVRVDSVCFATDCVFVSVTTIFQDTRTATTDFYRLTTTTVEKLSTSVQSEYGGAIAASALISSSYVNAIKVDDYYCIVATESWTKQSNTYSLATGKNLNQTGARAVFFIYRNGVCSEVEPIVPIAPDISDHTFYATGLVKIGSLYYLSGKMTRPFSDGTSVFMETYMTSNDCKKWSLGEWSSYVTSTNSMLGQLYQSGATIYYIGSGYCYSSPSRYIDGSGSVDTISNLTSAAYSFGTSNPDDLVMEAGVSHLSINSGDTITLAAGYRGSPDGFTQIGEFSVDMINYGRTPDSKTTEIQAMDKASWMLRNWKCNTDIVRSSQRRNTRDEVASLSEILIKNSFEDNPIQDGVELAWNRINTPLIAYTTFNDGRDGTVHSIVRFGDHNGKAISSFGFVFGADEKNFNVVTIPRQNSWTGNERTGPGWVIGKAVDFSYEAESKSLLAGDIRLTTDTAYTSPDVWNTFTASPNVDYMFSLRIAGNRVQVYRRLANSAPANAEANSESVLIAQWRTGLEPMRFRRDSHYGFIASTDSYSRMAPAHFQYDELSAGLSKVAEIYDFNRVVGTGTFNGGVNLNTTVALTLNQCLRITSGVTDMYCYVSAIPSTNNYTLTLLPNPPAAINGGFGTVNIRLQTTSNDFAYVDSGYSILTAVSGSTETIKNETGAFKTTDPIFGTAIIINENGTAVQRSEVRGDGIRSYLQNSTPNNGMGFSYATNPVPSPQFNAGINGSRPSDWRQIIWPSWLFEADTQTIGIPDTGYFVVEGEIIRYNRLVIQERGGANRVICWVPSYYFLSKGAAANSTNIAAWRDVSGNQPGDDVNTIWASGAGKYLLATISGMSSVQGEITDVSKQLYLDSITKVVSPTPSNTDSITLTSPYTMEVRGIGQNDFSIVRLDGRGQKGTLKAIHTDKARLTYYPMDAGTSPTNTALSDIIKVKKFEPIIGKYSSVQDNLDYVCKLAGVRNTKFRPLASRVGSLLGSEIMNVNVSDFVLDMPSVHIPQDSVGTLSIAFRGYYEVHLSANTDGTVNVSLRCPFSSIVGSTKTLHKVKIPVSAINISPTTSSYHGVRIVASEKLIIVEMDGQNLWTFNLDNYESQYKVLTAGSITLTKTGVSSTVEASLQELWGEVEDHFIDMGQGGFEAAQFILEDRHVFFRSTIDGGMEFSRFTNRDSGTAYGGIFSKVDTPTSIVPAGHVNVSGAEFGEKVDESWMQINGYRFDMGQNRYLNTVKDSQEEARFIIREAKAHALMRTLAIASEFYFQPEDEVIIPEVQTFPNGPSQNSNNSYIIESGSTTFQSDNIISNYVLKKKYDL